MHFRSAPNLGIILLPILAVGTLIATTVVVYINRSQAKVYQSLVETTPTPTFEPTNEAQETLLPLTPTPPTVQQTNTPSPTAKSSPPAAPTPQAVSGPPGSGYSRITVATEVGNYTVSVVSIDMAGVRIITDTANESDCANDCPVLSLQDFVTKNGGFAGINGSYFCPSTYPDCESKKNSFDFPVYNSRLNRWINQGNLFWNDRSIVYQDSSGVHFLSSAKSFGGSLSAGIVNHPGLLENGNIIVDQFPAYAKQDTKGTKAGIGIRGNVVYLVVAGTVTMRELGHIFKSMGATSALNLDGGGSTALWFNGYKAGPGRQIPNAIIFAR